MSGASGGVMGVNKVARETLDANVRPDFRKAGDWIHQHGRLPKTKYLLEVPSSFLNKSLLAFLGLSAAALWLNRRMYTTTVVSMEPEFQAAARRIGPVAERTDAPPVFLNPITNRIPGWCVGPDDVPK
eukprot:GHUV01000508.1.p1 GENE.GHUV01000508.1~~GHUV01000508.1.p1  ORF type:complete len:128 (+),score=28.69 GHUV01000508.1:156-539(+)